jgi:hypothetical protein
MEEGEDPPNKYFNNRGNRLINMHEICDVNPPNLI